jgi:hypothetical protein
MAVDSSIRTDHPEVPDETRMQRVGYPSTRSSGPLFSLTEASRLLTTIGGALLYHEHEVGDCP